MEKRAIGMVFKPIVFAIILVLLLNAVGFATSTAKIYTRIMMHEMYTEESIDIVFIGASLIYRGIDPAAIDSGAGVNSFNMGSSAQDVVDTYYLLSEMFRYHRPKMVFIAVSQTRLSPRVGTRHSEILFNYFRASPAKLGYLRDAFKPTDYYRALFPAIQYRDQNLSSSAGAVFGNVKAKLSPEYFNYSYSTAAYEDEWYSGKGFVYSTDSLPERNIGKRSTSKRVWKEERVSAEQVDCLEKSIRLCKENGSIPVLFDMPTTYFHASRNSNYSDYQEYIGKIASENGIDYLKLGLVKRSVFERNNSYFRDSHHMNGKGAEKFSSVIAKIVSEYMDGTFRADDYLYSSYQSMMEDFSFVFNTWIEQEESGFRAYASGGPTIMPEFEFLYKRANDTGYTLFRQYGEDPFAPNPEIDAERFLLRVNARSVGSAEGFEQYSEVWIGGDIEAEDVDSGNASDEGEWDE